MEESQAITRLKQGDISGLEALVHKYQVQAVRTAYLVVRDRALAEDIVQSAFVRVYDHIGQFDAQRPFAPWFLRAVVNDAIKAATRRERQVSLEMEADDETSLADLLVDPVPDPDDLAEASETREAIWAAMGKLAPHQRAVLVMRYYLDMSEAEMAAKLSSPPGTIKWWLHSARERLRKLLWPVRSET